mmetsp:Transcript_44638/g.82649  ORF Transcript_44638/g.82649 Transcript_44638/m.82649 type:complete len:243 (-) Transcript_44638:395-1123(-)
MAMLAKTTTPPEQTMRARTRPLSSCCRWNRCCCRCRCHSCRHRRSCCPRRWHSRLLRLLRTGRGRNASQPLSSAPPLWTAISPVEAASAVAVASVGLLLFCAARVQPRWHHAQRGLSPTLASTPGPAFGRRQPALPTLSSRALLTSLCPPEAPPWRAGGLTPSASSPASPGTAPARLPFASASHRAPPLAPSARSTPLRPSRSHQPTHPSPLLLPTADLAASPLPGLPFGPLPRTLQRASQL